MLAGNLRHELWAAFQGKWDGEAHARPSLLTLPLNSFLGNNQYYISQGLPLINFGGLSAFIAPEQSQCSVLIYRRRAARGGGDLSLLVLALEALPANPPEHLPH
jgi:hypothetical protein